MGKVKVLPLKYYATLKVKVWVVILQIYIFMQKATTCIGLQAEQIFSVNV